MIRPASPEDFIAVIFDLLERMGGDHYGEAVTQLDHALQTAHHAREAGETDALVAAALLHDIGHLLQKHGQDAADRGIDAVHERIGAAWLAQAFAPEVSEPVRLHVEAKRYLANAEPGYADALSPASLQSLHLQGGPMNQDEAAVFRPHPHFDTAIRLRCYDEMGKTEGAVIAPLATYRNKLTALAARSA